MTSPHNLARPLRIGTRGSALARWQAENVRALLAATGVAAELLLIRTSGDRDARTPLRGFAGQGGGKGIFTRELEDALLENRIDVAVHSMKDVPTGLPRGLVIAAMCRREDVRDALVSREGLGLAQLPPGARVGTGSLRRQAQLRHSRADLEMLEIRGNVDTRLEKVARGECDAVVLAKAGLDRLGMEGRITEVLSPEICLPAAGQGAIGMEARAPGAGGDAAEDAEIHAALVRIDHAETGLAVEAERAVLSGLEGGCMTPIGVWARMEADQFVIDACVLSPDGSEAARARRSGAARDSVDLARGVAAELLDRGAAGLLRAAGRSLGRR